MRWGNVGSCLYAGGDNPHASPCEGGGLKDRGGFPAPFPQAREQGKESCAAADFVHERQRAGEIPFFRFAPARRMEEVCKYRDCRREIFRNRRFLNGVLNQGSQQSPAPAGLLGKGGARERTQVSPLGGTGVERTLRRRAAVGKGTRRRSGEISFEEPWESVFHCVGCGLPQGARMVRPVSPSVICFANATSLVRGRLFQRAVLPGLLVRGGCQPQG